MAAIFPATNADIPDPGRIAGAVHDAAVADEEVEVLGARARYDKRECEQRSNNHEMTYLLSSLRAGWADLLRLFSKPRRAVFNNLSM